MILFPYSCCLIYAKSVTCIQVESSWNVMAHGDAREGKWRGNKRMECVTIKCHMTSERRLARAVQTLQPDLHSSPASSRLNWHPSRFKWTRPFRRKTKSGFCACAITFQTQSNSLPFHKKYVFYIWTNFTCFQDRWSDLQFCIFQKCFDLIHLSVFRHIVIAVTVALDIVHRLRQISSAFWRTDLSPVSSNKMRGKSALKGPPE
jgi:hypothetical protein